MSGCSGKEASENIQYAQVVLKIYLRMSKLHLCGWVWYLNAPNAASVSIFCLQCTSRMCLSSCEPVMLVDIPSSKSAKMALVLRL